MINKRIGRKEIYRETKKKRGGIVHEIVLLQQGSHVFHAQRARRVCASESWRRGSKTIHGLGRSRVYFVRDEEKITGAYHNQQGRSPGRTTSVRTFSGEKVLLRVWAGIVIWAGVPAILTEVSFIHGVFPRSRFLM